MHYPKLKAVCQDCLKQPQTETRVRLENMYDPLTILPASNITGTLAHGLLLMSCRNHHDHFRNEKGPKGEKLKHGRFFIYDENDVKLGEMGATSQAVEMPFFVENENLRITLHAESTGGNSTAEKK